MELTNGGSTYVLMTAAYNEELYIENAIQSVIQQSVRPLKWVIVSDGSTDQTDNIVRSYAAKYAFIQYLRRERDNACGFASKVFALQAALKELEAYNYEFIGNLDADITLESAYFSDLLAAFGENSHLGISAGILLEKAGSVFAPRGSNSLTSIPGAIQMFRRACYEEIGGFIPIEYGGEDWYMEVCARMKGWQVQGVSHLQLYHHRPTGTAGGRLHYWYRQGFMDFALGSHPVFEVVKLLRRFPEKPYVVGAATRWIGFVVAHFVIKRSVSSEFVRFLQAEQIRRLFPRRRKRNSASAKQQDVCSLPSRRNPAP